MKDHVVPKAGIIDAGKQRLAFYLNQYRLTLINTTIPDSDQPMDYSSIHFPGPFIYGRAFPGNDIALYTSVPTTFCMTRNLSIGAYCLAENSYPVSNWQFDRIVCQGGTLDELFDRATQDSESEFPISIDGQPCRLNLARKKCTRYEIGGESTLFLPELSLIFPEQQPLGKVFPYISRLKEAMAFLAMKKNVGFYKIYLHSEKDPKQYISVFIKEEYPVFPRWKHSAHLTFDDLKDYISPLCMLFLNRVPGTASYELGFLPPDERFVHEISDEQIQLIGSAIDCEFYFIQTHKTKSLGAVGKIQKLYEKHQKELSQLIGIRIIPTPATLDNFRHFVDYRNDITHGRYQIKDQKVSDIARILQKLIYCCLLTRLGMSSEEIQNLFHRKFLEC